MERFPPLHHLPMIGAFLAANALAARGLGGPTPGWGVLAAVALALLSFFFRMRIFDEIKDYATDLRVNPGRPLARGLISLREAKAVAFLLFGFEGALMAVTGLPGFYAWAAAAAYSLLMYREFFIGPWLRPKMEAYAISHTLVAFFLSLLVFFAFFGAPLRHVPISVLSFAVAGWMVFNVFEFARKTFGPGEEREGVDSYTSRLGPWGAGVTVSVMAWLAVAGSLPMAFAEWVPWALALLALLVSAASACMGAHYSDGAAARVRLSGTLFIGGFYWICAAGLFWGGVR
jgi:4-hydroxybenzoate polyprenyltransferase